MQMMRRVAMDYESPGAYWRSAKSAPFAKRILVACARGDVMIAVRAEYMGWMRDGDGSGIFDVVTHWRPLPDPPSTEKAPAIDRDRWAAEEAVDMGAKP